MAGEVSNRANGKKRARASFLADDSTPSDPALFSSDPADPSVEHYFSPRPKKQYRGTWWQSENQGRKVRKSFARNMDSGVFMGSDSSYESFDLASDAELKSDDTVPDETTYAPVREIPTGRHQPVRTSETRVVALARQRIEDFAEGTGSLRTDEGSISEVQRMLENSCAKKGVELRTLGLYDLGLSQLSDDMVLPLHHLVKPPSWAKKADSRRMHSPERWTSPDSDGDFESLSSNIALDLSQNALKDLPPSLFSIAGLSCLNVRNNNLSVLPANIHKAMGLCALDIAGNRLRWLPGEVLDMLRTSSSCSMLLDVVHNPFVQPFSYVGFYNGLLKDLHTETQIPVSTNHQVQPLIPTSITEIRRRIQQLQHVASIPEERERSRLSQMQRSWLARLYENFLALPELIWILAGPEEILASVTEEQEEIISRWRCPEGHLKKLVQNGDADPGPTMAAIFNLKSQLQHAVKHNTILIAATSICYLDTAGHPVHPEMPLPSTLRPDETILPARLIKVPPSPALLNEPGKEIDSLDALRPPRQMASATKHSSVRSLFSLCLRSGSSAVDVRQLRDLLPDNVSPLAQIGLDAAIQAQQEGGRTCSMCRRTYIIPRAEWVEYHHILHREQLSSDIDLLFVPFLRRVCSWACVPDLDFDD